MRDENFLLEIAGFVVCLLLLCGDIESNPGPNPNPSSTQGSPLLVKTNPRVTRGQSTLPFGDSRSEKSSDIDIAKSLVNITQALGEIMSQLDMFKSELVDIKIELQTMIEVKENLSVIQKENNVLKEKLEKLEENVKVKNLIVFGMIEAERETATETEARVRAFLADKLGVEGADCEDKLPIDRCFRFGRKVPDKCRPILVTVLLQKHKTAILNAFKTFRQNSESRKTEYIKEDFSERVRNIRSKLGAILFKVKSAHPGELIALKYDKLIYRGQAYTYNSKLDCVVACDGDKDVPNAIKLTQ
ncbi:hypothetical protein SNE40_002827 [Patella caerulea]|uniref:Uncharacterized protein n=1 Tax=Patella caerulea TaxID=87958 RepID=A0AAN8KER1_PATCE